MDFTLVAIDVDGTLHNPTILAGAVAVAGLWAIALVVLIRAAQRRRRITAAISAIIGLFLCVYSRELTRFVAEATYGAQGHWGVGFFYSTPVWFSPALGIAFAGVFLAWQAFRNRGAERQESL